MSGLAASQRVALERLIVRARTILEGDLAAQAEGRYGINGNGTIENEEALRLDPGALLDRREIVAVVEHLRSEGEEAAGAVARLIREAAFTHLNRLVAIRVAEALELVPASLADGRASQGFRDVLEVAPLIAGDATGGYWTYLRLCGDEMASDAPVLFDPRNPLLTLSPSVAALDELVTLFSDPGAKEIWTASDTFGWAYQFFNTGDERRQMRDASPAPRNSRELAVRNQFFTPRYVVDFLVQNTLGRRLLEAQIDSALIETLPLVVDPPTEAGEPLPLNAVRILDPACGSGHFLLGCYDLLERAWQLEGVEPSEAAPLIIPTLWGIDIDPRCAQVASAAIVFRARRRCRDLPLPRPNVITARALPDGSESWERLLASLPPDRRDLVTRMREVLAEAQVLGPLLKAEEVLAAEIRRYFTGSDTAEGTLAEGIAPDAFGEVESEVIGALQQAADSASSSAAERLLAAEAGDAIRFVEAMRQRYDVVLMNPPFGQPVPASRDYIRFAYSDAAADLYACFVERGLDLLHPSGLLGAITNRTGFFLSSLEEWRKRLLRTGLVCLADLGAFVLEGAQVEVAAYVAGREADSTTFIRGLLMRDKERALVERRSDLIFRVKASRFLDLPGACFDYWVGESLLDAFSRLPAFGQDARIVSRGISAGDNFRFIRTMWEMPAQRIGSTQWVPLSKGGEYSPFYDDVHLLLDWRNGPSGYADVSGARIFNLELQGRSGVYWPKRTTSLPSARPLPAGTFFEANSIPIFTEDASLALSWANSRIFVQLFLMQVGAGDTARGSAAKDWITGPARRIPWAEPDPPVRHELAESAERAATLQRELALVEETSPYFIRPALLLGGRDGLRNGIEGAFGTWLSAEEDKRVEILELAHQMDKLWLETYAVDEEAKAGLDLELEPHPCSYEADRDVDVAEFARAYLTKGALVQGQELADVLDSRARARLGPQVSFRSLVDLSHIFRLHPRAVIARRRELQLMRREELVDDAKKLVSYLFGVTFGRWDLEIGLDGKPTPALPMLFDPVPKCAPGMLVDAADLPAEEAPPGYPLSLPAVRLLVDEPGHEWDIEAALLRAAEVMFEEPDSVVAEMLESLRKKTLREYLRKDFFKDHLSRYSKSRRKAPIYWPLSTPSRNWGLWVYAPALSREALFAIAGEAARREALVGEAIRRLETERESRRAGRSGRELNAALAAEEALAGELGRFKGEAERIAGLGWEPDPDDGIILCAAPLATLLPAWPDAAKEREQIRKGEYPWATVFRWKDEL